MRGRRDEIASMERRVLLLARQVAAADRRADAALDAEPDGSSVAFDEAMNARGMAVTLLRAAVEAMDAALDGRDGAG